MLCGCFLSQVAILRLFCFLFGFPYGRNWVAGVCLFRWGLGEMDTVISFFLGSLR